ncbi:MAG TPA: SAM-dependent methyltransferase [Streptosporangiaceae bacterium]|nr:SAM-dependent methyltransferase [Streptosporangiaceae bacterium]
MTGLAASGPADLASAGVGRTALGVAMVRAMESRRRDRLFCDPYAAAFLAAAPEVFNRAERGAVACLSGLSRTGTAFWSRAVIRTRFFDDYLVDAVGGGLRQVVLLAAGLDTRAFRLNWPPDVRLFELDLPEVLEFKRQVLASKAAKPRCDYRPVPADLREDWAAPLTGIGLRADQPTAWLLEGLLIYLSAAEVGHLLATLSELSAPGSRVAFESENADAEALRRQASELPALAEYTDLWKGGLADPVGCLADHGWQTEMHDGVEAAIRYGRSTAGSSPADGGFLTATRP